MKYCQNCGSAIADTAKFCENCGASISQPAQRDQAIPTPITSFNPPPQQKRTSGLGITAFILSLLMITAPIAVILAIIDLICNKNKKHGLSVAALIIGSIITAALIAGISKQGGITGSSSSSSASSSSAVSDALAKRQYIDSCKNVEYKDVARNPDNYKGKLVCISGRVIQVSEQSSYSSVFRISSSDDFLSDDVWYVTFYHKSNEKRILEDDNVIVYGECLGVTTYTAILGNRITVPAIDAKYIELVENDNG